MSLVTLSFILYSHLVNTCRLILGLPPIPYKWLIQLTNDCNSRCESCDIWKINKDSPDKKNRESTLSDYHQLFAGSGTQLKWLALSGGEISLYQNFNQFSSLIKKYCPHLKIITFTTNGLNPQRVLEIADQLSSLARDIFIVISLDGDEKLHDQLRGVPGNYQKAQKTHQLLKAAGHNVYFGSTLSNKNQNWLMSNTNQVKSISLIHSQGIFERSNDIDDLKLAQALRIIVKNYRINSLAELGEYFYLKLGFLFLKSGREKLPIPCDSLNSSLHISPYGEIKPCMYLASIGNIKKSSIQDCLTSPQAQEMRNIIAKEHCPKCWMNCYAPHSIIQSPLQTVKALIKAV